MIAMSSHAFDPHNESCNSPADLKPILFDPRQSMNPLGEKDQSTDIAVSWQPHWHWRYPKTGPLTSTPVCTSSRLPVPPVPPYRQLSVSGVSLKVYALSIPKNGLRRRICDLAAKSLGESKGDGSI